MGPSRCSGQKHSHHLWHLPLSFTPHQPAGLLNVTSTRFTDSLHFSPPVPFSFHTEPISSRLRAIAPSLALYPQSITQSNFSKVLKIPLWLPIALSKRVWYQGPTVLPKRQRCVVMRVDSRAGPHSTRWVTLGRSFSFSGLQFHRLQKEDHNRIYRMNTSCSSVTYYLLVSFLSLAKPEVLFSSPLSAPSKPSPCRPWALSPKGCFSVPSIPQPRAYTRGLTLLSDWKSVSVCTPVLPSYICCWITLSPLFGLCLLSPPQGSQLWLLHQLSYIQGNIAL